jgi:hypothetical protein
MHYVMQGKGENSQLGGASPDSDTILDEDQSVTSPESEIGQNLSKHEPQSRSSEGIGGAESLTENTLIAEPSRKSLLPGNKKRLSQSGEWRVVNGCLKGISMEES